MGLQVRHPTKTGASIGNRLSEQPVGCDAGKVPKINVEVQERIVEHPQVCIQSSEKLKGATATEATGLRGSERFGVSKKSQRGLAGTSERTPHILVIFKEHGEALSLKMSKYLKKAIFEKTYFWCFFLAIVFRLFCKKEFSKKKSPKLKTSSRIWENFLRIPYFSKPRLIPPKPRLIPPKPRLIAPKPRLIFLLQRTKNRNSQKTQILAIVFK